MASDNRFSFFSRARQPQQAAATNKDTKSEQKHFKECMPIYDNDGNLVNVLNTKTGKLEEPRQEKLAFDPDTGKLGLVKVHEGINTDYQIQLGMAEDGFFMLNVLPLLLY